MKVVLGTDANAGAHSRNYEEFIYRVKEGGDKPMDAILSGTSVAAESLGLGNRIGTVAPGFEADLVAVGATCRRYYRRPAGEVRDEGWARGPIGCGGEAVTSARKQAFLSGKEIHYVQAR